jgi:hypothetical protein
MDTKMNHYPIMRRKTMKTTSLTAFAAALFSAAPAIAASGAREDNSGFFVWLFLGLCAAIVVAQLLPALMMVLGFAKGFRKHEAAKESVKH